MFSAEKAIFDNFHKCMKYVNSAINVDTDEKEIVKQGRPEELKKNNK